MPQAHRPILFRRPPLLGPGWNPGRASRASKVAGAFLVLFWRAKENISSATLCFVKVIIVERCASGKNPLSRLRRQLVPLFVAWRERVASGTNPLSLAALDSSPEGRALGKEGKFRPRRTTAGRSQPISGKLSALAKASPFRERWHGEAVTERVEPPPQPSFGPAERPAYSRSTSIPIVFSLFSYFIIEMMFAQVN